MENREYLLCYGKAGDFGCFEADEPLTCRRGERLVIRSQRGEEIGVVMRPAAAGHMALLGGQHVGRILRIAEATDLELDAQLRARSQRLFLDARRLAAERSLPLAVLDAEILFDGRQGILYCVNPPGFEAGPFIEAVAGQSGLAVCCRDLAVGAGGQTDQEPVANGGCGAPNCGAASGGCGSCSSGACSSCALHDALSKSPRSQSR
jgi:hypothetical protein